MTTMKKQKHEMQEEIEEQMDCEETTQGQFYHPIDELQQYQINASVIQKLKEGGYQTIMSIVMAPTKELVNVKGIGEANVPKIKEAAKKVEFQQQWVTGAQVLQQRQNIIKLTTGSKIFDQCLGGGIESQSLTEVYGEYRTGKTYLCHQLCVTAQLGVKDGGGGGKVAYLDTEGTFRPENIQRISERYGLDCDAVLNNILYGRAYNVEHLNELLIPIAAKMFEEKFALLIVDSIMALFRVDFSGRGELSERQQILNKTLSKLSKIANQFNVAVLMTNQVQSDPSGGMPGQGDMKKPVGGNVIAHASTTRIFLKKGKKKDRKFTIVDSPHLPEEDGTFTISETGIIDTEDNS